MVPDLATHWKNLESLKQNQTKIPALPVPTPQVLAHLVQSGHGRLWLKHLAGDFARAENHRKATLRKHGLHPVLKAHFHRQSCLLCCEAAALMKGSSCGLYTPGPSARGADPAQWTESSEDCL